MRTDLTMLWHFTTMRGGCFELGSEAELLIYICELCTCSKLCC